jgi:tRNA 2-thiocytidine biosynthesis protein TtcA
MKERRTEQRVLERVGRAIEDFSLIVPGDRILVAVSGGKDSFGLLWALLKKQASSPFHFDLIAYHLDQGQPGHDTTPIEAHFQKLGLPYEIGFQDTYKRVLQLTEPGKVYCSVCAHFRRAILYRAATKHGCNKVALGHHRDDLIETLMLNVLFSGQIKSMPPKLRADDGAHEVIRPLCYVPEEEMIELSRIQEFPVVPCSLCGSQNAQRKYVKNLLSELSAHSQHVKGNLLAALSNVHLTHLMDRRHNPHLKEPGEEGRDALGEAPRRSHLPIVESD